MGKILFIDIDGTLVDYENRLPAWAVKAIRMARAAGHRVYLCSGRSKAENKQEIWDIGLDGYIGGNGSYVESDGEVVMHQLVTPEQCRRIVDWLHSRKLEFYLESNSGLYGSENFRQRAVPVMKEYCRRKGKADADQASPDTVFPTMIYGADLYRDDVNQVSYILDSYPDFLDAREQFPDLQNGTWGGAGGTALFGDLGVKGITKAHAVEVLLKHLNARQEDTIAFGDAAVDIPMFEVCAQSCCMGSGGDGAKAAAGYVTTAVEEDGLYNAFVHFGLL